MAKHERVRAEHPNQYVIDFPIVSTEITAETYGKYHPFDTVTRQSVTSFLIRSFLESRGKIPYQVSFCTLASLHTGLDVSQTLRELLHEESGRARGFYRLDPYEQEQIIMAYRGFEDVAPKDLKIAHHLFPRRTIHISYTDRKIGEKFTGQLSELLVNMDDPTRLAFPVRSSMTYQEFKAIRDKKLY